MIVRVGRIADLDGPTVYGLLRLRAEAFVVEQQCAYLDPDGRDLDDGALQLWVEEAGAAVASLRLLTEPDGTRRIGRVVTGLSSRRRGLSAELVRHAVGLAGGWPVVLDAQTQLVGWYEQLGFLVDGEPFVEDGIPHTPMRLG